MTNPKLLLIFFLAFSISAAHLAQANSSLTWQPHTHHASSTTHSGIGISTSTDTTGAIKPIAKVNGNLNAQVAITQSFSQQAAKAVATGLTLDTNNRQLPPTYDSRANQYNPTS